MLTAMLLIVFQEKVEPINVKLGDPVLPIEVTNHDGAVFSEGP